MPGFYDIYGFSKQRNKETIEKFLDHFSDRNKIENRDGQEILVYQNEKYNIEETCVQISNLSEVIDFGLKNNNLGFVFYIDKDIKADIKNIILKFTFDGNIIFGISIEENRFNSIDNYHSAVEIGKTISALTDATKTSVQFEYAPADDEDEFDSNVKIWQQFNKEK